MASQLFDGIGIVSTTKTLSNFDSNFYK